MSVGRARTLGLLLVCSLGFVVAHAQAQKSAQPPADARAPTPADAQVHAEQVAVEVLVVLGRSEAGASDPQLERLEALRKAPFDGFATKTLLGRSELKLEPGAPSELDLPNGRKLRLTLRAPPRDGHLKINLSINRPGQGDYLREMNVTAAPGDWFFVAGQKYEGGTLIVGVRVGARP